MAERGERQGFKEIWALIKKWDVQTPWSGGRHGATGTEVDAILDALEAAGLEVRKRKP